MDIDAGGGPTNITNTPGLIEDDADWSPDGRKIVYTRHVPTIPDPNNLHYRRAIRADGEPGRHPGAGPEQPAAIDLQRRRGASSCLVPGRHADCVHVQGGAGDASDFEICVMNADGTGG